MDNRPIAIATIILTPLALAGARRVLPGMSVPRRAVLLIPLVTYPLVYYLVGYEPRYRQPLDGLLLLLAAAALVQVRCRPCDSPSAPSS